MGKVKDFRLFIAEDLCAKNELVDLDEGFKMADELWKDATVRKNKKSQAKIGRYAKKYRGK